MSKRKWKLFAMDMLEAIEKIEKYTAGISYNEFMKDAKTKDAVVRNLEIVGEAANRIPEEIKQRYEEIPWSQIVGMRHRLIHGYFVVDYDIVWNIIKNELSTLRDKLREILKNEE